MPSVFHAWTLAFRIARRDLRGAWKAQARTLGLLVAGVLVGVAAVALVGAAAQSLRDGAGRGALEAVGGDLSLRLYHRGPTATQRAMLGGQGEISVISELRPMLQAKGRSLLVEMKGVDDAYPLYGEIKTDGDAPLSRLLADGGAVADAALFDELGLRIGDTVHVGAATYQLRARLVAEPDRAFRAFTLGPRIMVAADGVAATGLADPGAEIYHYIRLKLPPSVDAAEALARIDRTFPDAGWRMVNARDGVPGVERTLAMAHVVLLFIGLSVLLIGGAGISGAVRAHLNAKMDTIAILKSIGTAPGVIAAAMGLEVFAGVLAGVLAGVGVGAFAPVLMVWALADQVPFALDIWPRIQPLVAAALFGVLIAALFAWTPLWWVRRLSTRDVLRARFASGTLRDGLRVLKDGGYRGVFLILAAIVAVVAWASPMPVASVVFLSGGLVLALVYWALGRAFAHLARKVATGVAARHVLARLALGNLYRAGAPTAVVVMALGLTVTVLVALDGLQNNAARHVANTLPATAPDVVLFSIAPARIESLKTQLQDFDGLRDVQAKPFLHARLQAINGRGVRDLDIPASLNWVVRGDRGVSFVARMATDDSLRAGQGWGIAESREPLLSVDDQVARKLGLGVGDELTLNVSGHAVSGRIANLRRIDWTGLGLDFPIVASSGALAHVPHSYAAALKVAPGRLDALQDFLQVQAGDVPRIRVADVIAALGRALDAIVSGLSAAALLTGAAAGVVLAGSVLQGLSARLDEALLFKVLGARRGQVLGMLAAEFALLGVLVALASVPVGLVLAYGVSHAAGLGHGAINIAGALSLAGVAVSVCVVVGLAATWGAYTAAPSLYLRNREV